MDYTRNDRPPFDVRTVAAPFPGVPEPRTRGDQWPRMRETYRRTLAIQINVAIGATEHAVSAQLHQPFRVDAVGFSGVPQGSQDIRGSIVITKQDLAAGGAGDGNTRPIWSPSGEIANLQMIRIADLEAGRYLGQIVYDVPARVGLICQNSTAGAIAIVAIVTVTCLVPAE